MYVCAYVYYVYVSVCICICVCAVVEACFEELHICVCMYT